MNSGLRMYLMNQGNQPGTRPARMETEDGKYQERGIGNDEHGYPLPYHEPRPEFGETEARYRGEDGRYKSGTRRNEYDAGPESREGGWKRQWEVSVEPKNDRHTSPYMPRNTEMYRDERNMPRSAYEGRMGDYGRMEDDDYEDPTGRVIGFNSFRSHMEEKKHSRMPERGMHSMHQMEFGREQAMDWVDGMKNEDPQHPKGGMWNVDFLKPMAQKLGIPASGPEFWKFYATTNAKYSDYSEILKKYGVNNPMCYAELAVAFMHDKDAIDDKTEVYYECIVLPKREEEEA